MNRILKPKSLTSYFNFSPSSPSLFSSASFSVNGCSINSLIFAWKSSQRTQKPQQQKPRAKIVYKIQLYNRVALASKANTSTFVFLYFFYILFVANLFIEYTIEYRDMSTGLRIWFFTVAVRYSKISRPISAVVWLIFVMIERSWFFSRLVLGFLRIFGVPTAKWSLFCW